MKFAHNGGMYPLGALSTYFVWHIQLKIWQLEIAISATEVDKVPRGAEIASIMSKFVSVLFFKWTDVLS